MSSNVGNFGDSGDKQLKRRLEGVPLPNYSAPADADDLAVDRFAAAMKAKMAASCAKGRGGWDDPAQCPVERLQAMLLDHLAKGDPVDIGNFAMMLHQRGAPVVAPAAATHEPDGWRDFLVRLGDLEGSMVNGNRLSRAAKELLAAAPTPPETWKVLPSQLPAAEIHVCPACLGRPSKPVVAFMNTGEDWTQHFQQEVLIPCQVCSAAGTLTDAVNRRYFEGRLHRHVRAQRGETMRDAAIRVGVTVPQVSAWELGYADLPTGEPLQEAKE